MRAAAAARPDTFDEGRWNGRRDSHRMSSSIAASRTAYAAATDQTEPRWTVSSAQSGAASQWATWAM
jgi:hypothetical protein